MLQGLTQLADAVGLVQQNVAVPAVMMLKTNLASLPFRYFTFSKSACWRNCTLWKLQPPYTHNSWIFCYCRFKI